MLSLPRRLRPTAVALVLASLPASAAPLAQDPAPDDDAEARWIDVRALDGATVAETRRVDLRLPLGASFIDRLEPSSWDVPLGDPFTVDAFGLAETIFEALGPDWPDPDLAIDARGGYLRVRGDARTQSAVDELLALLSSQLLASVELEVAVLDGASLPDGVAPALTAAEADALLATAGASSYVRKVVPLERRVHLGEPSLRSFLYDYDVEVAQHARVVDPVVSIFPSGLELGAVVNATSDGRLLLRLWGRSGELEEPVRRLALGELGGAELELPVAASTLCVGTGTVEDGGALLLGAVGAGTSPWLVRARRIGDAAEGAGGARRALPIGDLVVPTLLASPPKLPRTSPSGGWYYHDEPSLADRLRRDEGELPYTAEDVLDLAYDLRDRGDLDGSVQLLGDTLLLGGEALATRTEARVAELRSAFAPPTARVELRYDILGADEARALVAGAEPADVADRLARGAVGTCRLGDALLVADGRERMYLQDVDVEIAQGAAIGDPIIALSFDGISLWCRPERRGDEVLAWTELVVHGPTGAPEPIDIAVWKPSVPLDTEARPGGGGTIEVGSSIELSRTPRAASTTLARARDGEWTLLAVEPLGGTSDAVVACLRISVGADD